MDEVKVLYAVIGVLGSIIAFFAKYVFSRFAALEKTVAEDRREYLRHEDMQRYITPLEHQLKSMNETMTKWIMLQMEQSSGDKK